MKDERAVREDITALPRIRKTCEHPLVTARGPAAD
jgi:hypothetical protein